MEHLECYISSEGNGIFIRNLVNGKMIGINCIEFGMVYNYFSRQDQEGVEFSELESYDDFWGSDLTCYYIRAANTLNLDLVCFFFSDKGKDDYRVHGTGMIFIKYFTSLFLQLIDELLRRCDFSLYQGEICFIRRFRWDEGQWLPEFYDLVEYYLEELMNLGPLENNKHCFVVLSEFRWYREVVGL